MERSFDLHVTSLDQADSFRVYAASETQGQAEGIFDLEATFEPLSQFLGRPIGETTLDLAVNGSEEGPILLPGVSAGEGVIKTRSLEDRGAALYQALFSGAVGTLFNLSLGEVLKDEQGALRLRLRIDPPKLTVLPWELLYDPDRGRFLAAWSKTLLSRSLGLLEPLRSLAAPGLLRLLAIFPRSSGLSTTSEKQALENMAADTGGRIEVRCLEGVVTLKAVREALRREEIHMLHYAGHGVFQEDQAAIFLDHPAGEGADSILAPAFARLLQESPSLRLVVLNSCKGATRSSVAALAGIAPQLLRHGVPAVVAMQALITDQQALELAAELYSDLAVGYGQVERAVARARSVLLQRWPQSPAFANPVLYLRAPDGRLWFPPMEPARPVGSKASFATVPHRPLPLPPPSFLGRESDLRSLKASLCRAPGEGAERGPVLLLTGWPGVGKTTMSMALANDPELHEVFPDGILWTSLDQSPSLVTEISSWSIALGSPGPPASATVEEASLQLGHLLRRRRVLLLLDDVWETSDAVPFLVGGPRCAMLATTRLDAVASQLATTTDSIYRLPLLSEDAGLELLRSRAPQVVEHFPEECRVLVRELEGLPLSLHVAGRMLAEESRLWSPGELLRTLQEGRQLLEQTAPTDRTDLRSQTLPTLSVLLAKSTERLSPEFLERFAFLGVFAPKPATFDLSALRAMWDIEDPKPAVRILVNFGLLEPTGDGRFRMHALLVAHAKSLLES